MLSDQLVDCQDPDCCEDTACNFTAVSLLSPIPRDQTSYLYCEGSYDPKNIIKSNRNFDYKKSFFDRVKFFVEGSKVQRDAFVSSFNAKFVLEIQ